MYVSLQIRAVCIEGRVFRAACERGSMLFAHVTLGYVYHNGLDDEKIKELPRRLHEILREDCGATLKEIERVYMQAKDLTCLERPSLVGIADNQMNILFRRIIDKSVDELALFCEEPRPWTVSRFHTSRSGFHVRMESDLYYPECMETVYEFF